MAVTNGTCRPGGGYNFYKDAKFRRITRYRYNSVPMDSVGRYFYIKDGATVWNPGWKPCKTELDSYECRHGLNYTRITGVKNKVRASVLFFVPLGVKAETYAMVAVDHMPDGYVPAVWGNVAELAYLDMLVHFGSSPDLLLAHLKPYLEEANTVSVFKSPYGNRESDFFWGCNSEGCCWRGVECLYAYRMTGEEQYRIQAERCLNYILGQNATGFCYVTGFGTHPTSHPHHRLSYNHPKGTLPGFLAGGPNPARQDAATDGVKYPKDVPADESYLDYQPSYASNEVTINWNVTLFALTAGLDALE